ncbi:MAG TPA: hypothetical protein DCP97_04760, partial [Ruminococcaceae bacterium]|nr:hypothetical protein [Oscillospiraceae bacterium]
MYIDLNSLDFDDKIFASKIEDMFILCDKNSSVKFSNFLDERQQALAAQIAGKYKHINYCFFTGINDCERAVMCVLPAFADKNQVSAPIKIISVKFRQQDKLTHRDFLGALMALKIKRDSLGDIIVDEGKAYIVCNSIAGEIIVNELKTVGRIGVECFYEDNPI